MTKEIEMNEKRKRMNQRVHAIAKKIKFVFS